MDLRVILMSIGVLCCSSVSESFHSSRTYLIQDPTDRDVKTLVVVDRRRTEDGQGVAMSCKIIEGNGPIEEFLKMSPDPGHVEMHPSAEELQEVMEDCDAFSLTKRRRRREAADENADSYYDDDINIEGGDGSDDYESTTEMNETPALGVPGFNLIFPGTKWCGNGDVARKFDDLGFHQDTDRCCRAHDLCDDTMAGGETKNNLTNKSPFTALSCKCDHEFYDCLDRVNTLTSNTVGNSYFNILKRPCYALDYPPTKKCKKYKTFLKLRCLEYEKDKSAEKVYQWIPARHYKKLPIPGPLTVSL